MTVFILKDGQTAEDAEYESRGVQQSRKRGLNHIASADETPEGAAGEDKDLGEQQMGVTAGGKKLKYEDEEEDQMD